MPRRYAAVAVQNGRDRSPERSVSTDSYNEFERAALAQGFDEVLVRDWAPDLVIERHVHPFAVKARVVRGEVWLTVGEDTRQLQAGQGFELEREVPHAERYGREGATFWVARRHATAAG
jgi:quercetin dioxygenase-like cupin family protein